MSIDPTINLINCINLAEKIESQAVQQGKKQKRLESLPAWVRKICNFFDPERNQLNRLGKNCSQLFDKVEKVPVLFSSDPTKVQTQNHCYRTCLKTAQTVMSILSKSSEVKVKGSLHNLMQRVAALQYRIEAVNGGLERSSEDTLLSRQLCHAALEWKKNYKLLLNKELEPHEVEKLAKASTYPRFAEVLLASKALQNAFFSWVLRDNNGIEQFVQFPVICQKLKAVYLASRIGRLGETMLCIQKKETEQKDLEKVISLPFYIKNKVEYVSVLDESKEVELKENWRLSINQIFNVFAKKNAKIGDLEIFQSIGITNWNCHEYGSWNPATSSYNRIDLTATEWWKELPVVEEITPQELEKRAGVKLNAGEWIAFAKASRTTPDMDLDGRHGYIELAIPTGNGTYGVYPFGNFAEDFPTTIVQLALFIAKTQRGKISYPDENFFYSHRQQATCPIRLTDEQKSLLSKALQVELIKACHGQVIFQFGGENCAYWAQNVLHAVDKTMPNFYKTDFVYSRPRNPVLGKIFDLIRAMPAKWQPLGIKTLDTVLGSSRGIKVFENRQKVYKSHRNRPVRNEFMIYQPGYLHRQIEEGKIEGYISTGSCR